MKSSMDTAKQSIHADFLGWKKAILFMARAYLDNEQLKVHVAKEAAEKVPPEELAFGAIHGQHVSASQHLR